MSHEQEWVVPVMHIELQRRGPELRQLLGTAFFLNTAGSFMTAAHVLKDGQAAMEQKGGTMALACSLPDNSGPEFRPILEVSYAREPYDVAVGCVGSNSVKIGSVGGIGNKPRRWDAVQAIGYPLTAQVDPRKLVHTDPRSLYSEPRGYRGHVLRSLSESRQVLADKEHPDGYELDFTIPLGMSGSPLVIAKGHQFSVVGVCVGNSRAEVQDYRVVLIEEDGKQFSERHIAKEYCGLADDVTSLIDWTPACFGGISLSGIGIPNSRRPF